MQQNPPASNPKQAAGEAALRHVRPNTPVGLGTGSTTDFFLIALGREITAGRIQGVAGVPTSERSAKRSSELGIPLTTLTTHPRLDVAVDGADEIATTGGLPLIKGLGGALLREKIVAQAAGKFVVIADSGKVTAKLGTRSPLPVEVVQFEHAAHLRFFQSLGAQPTLRLIPNSTNPYITDNGNLIYDLRFPTGIDNPADLELKLLRHAGVVETGLFLGIASLALIAGDTGVSEMHP
jgi:ribose 5-phosphate isomerase A